MARKRFEIILADTAGFCMGVRRAVRMVLRAADQPAWPSPIRIQGPLIHNRQVLRVLEDRGVLTDEEGSDWAGGTAVVRAHGLSGSGQEQLRRRAAVLLDATCPHVRRVQKIVEEYAAQGYMCVVVGDAGHAEVDAVLSYAGAEGRVISGPGEVDELPDAERVVVVAQTTQDQEVFRRTAERMRARYPECRAFETVCRSTEQRQAEVRELAGRVEAMIVVGGLHSANTRRLAQISAATGTPTFHVETDAELDLNAMLSHERVGLTAGASTPNWMIRRVMRRLEDEHRRRTRPLRYWALTFVRGLVNANVYAAGAAAALSFACALLLSPRHPMVGACMAVAFFFVLGQQLLNQYGRRGALYLSEPDRAGFFMANEGALLLLGVCSSVLALFLAHFLGWVAFGLIALGSAGGLTYRVPLPGRLTRRLGFRSLEQLPGSKELFVGLAWASLAALVPALAAPGAPLPWRAAAVAFAVAFAAAFQRTLALELLDVRADKIVGRETLAGVLGPRVAQKVLYGLIVLVAAVLAGAGCLAGWTTDYCLPLLAAVPAALGCFALAKRSGVLRGEVSELAVDAQFYLVALAALAWSAAAGGAG